MSTKFQNFGVTIAHPSNMESVVAESSTAHPKSGQHIRLATLAVCHQNRVILRTRRSTAVKWDLRSGYWAKLKMYHGSIQTTTATTHEDFVNATNNSYVLTATRRHQSDGCPRGAISTGRNRFHNLQSSGWRRRSC